MLVVILLLLQQKLLGIMGNVGSWVKEDSTGKHGNAYIEGNICLGDMLLIFCHE